MKSLPNKIIAGCKHRHWKSLLRASLIVRKIDIFYWYSSINSIQRFSRWMCDYLPLEKERSQEMVAIPLLSLMMTFKNLTLNSCLCNMAPWILKKKFFNRLIWTLTNAMGLVSKSLHFLQGGGFLNWLCTQLFEGMYGLYSAVSFNVCLWQRIYDSAMSKLEIFCSSQRVQPQIKCTSWWMPIRHGIFGKKIVRKVTEHRSKWKGSFEQ